MKRPFNPWLFVILIVLGVVIFNQFSARPPGSEITYSTFTQLVEEGRVASVVLEENTIRGELREETQIDEAGQTRVISSFQTTALPVEDSELLPLLRANDVEVRGRAPSPWLGLIVGFLPVLLIIAFFWFIFMRAQGGSSQVMQFGQSKAKTYGRENKVKTTFEDVAGHEEAKQELKEVVDFLKNPQKYLRIGAEIPKGMLLVGPPGTGKTLLARAVAGEAGVPFLTVSASEFMEMFVGVGASRVRNLFEEARKASPAIIFIDELDSIGRRRGAGIGGGHDEREQTLNQILSEMDGFEKDTSVIIIAATNRPDILDPALLRPGRFDRQVTIGLPTLRERAQVLRVHVRNKPIADDVDIERLASATPMFSGADLENLTNEAALIAARSGKQVISWADFNEALDRIVLGLRRGSLVPTEEERKILAFHEAGHAVAFASQPDLGQIRKVTIMPRGGAGGFMAPLAKEEMFFSRERFQQQLIVAFGGRVAEKKLTGTISSGASNDLKQATDIAKQMVFDLGMGGPEYVAWGSDQGPVFLGGEISRRKDFSEETARELEEEVTTILAEAYRTTETVIEENWTAVRGVAEALLQRETVEGTLVMKAFERAKEGASAEEITRMIVEESEAAERRMAAAAQRAAEADKQRRREAEGRSSGPAIDTRPAPEGPRS
ncbi:ATP-dependent zinc metalloprotease FtsH [Truepera radiovictrix]|uniref:ATP-dependent zinc metalloprotease FtsH n=1 Tax=Truepera radiovictrix (strain DSM 17093 / CIP 108686 / LMG 22925 / RQ-24) TaxID=649638 RepID=D7CV09_TRURR|nr:ATP-dependent zinc metalloprotease FtsH [Truepera radiovictrix]ADI15836.1 ATP-dependent metalloprotease FtsH [Truepera radiovictrix DSM 17093]WMT58538.1 ATP-dependent zinc metalloprotease FtsH [Truepera radiovictrix]